MARRRAGHPGLLEGDEESAARSMPPPSIRGLAPIDDADTPPRTYEHARGEEDEAVRQGRIAASFEGSGDSFRIGLALSGGGIRSATFSLGVIQALARARRLTAIDYLSTVSGGGYIGGWLTAWIHRKGLDRVQNTLSRERSSTFVEAPEIAWLRRYSNYLAPKLGLLSADSMTLVATWTRNVLLNLVVVISMIALLTLLPRLLLEPVMYLVAHRREEVGYAAMWCAFFLFPLAISFNLMLAARRRPGAAPNWWSTTGGVFAAVLIPGMVTTVLASIAIFNVPSGNGYDALGLAVAAAILLIVAGVLWAPWSLGHNGSFGVMAKEGLVFGLAYVGALVTGLALLKLFTGIVIPTAGGKVEGAANLLTFGPPALLVTFGVAGSVIVGLVGRVYEERTREWWGRMNAWFVTLGLAWLALFLLSFYVSPVLRWAQAHSDSWAAGLAGAGWLGTLVTTLLAPKPDAKASAWSRWAVKGMNLLATIAVAGFFIAVAAAVWFSLAALSDAPRASPMGEQGRVAAPLADFVTASFSEQTAVVHSVVPKDGVRQGFLWGLFDNLRLDTTLALALGCLVLFVLFGFRVDVNKFSLHDLYKNRLIRCYLGASRQEARRAHPFTGFDEKDDVGLVDLQESGVEVRRGEGRNPPVRPVHLLNAALNLTQGDNLAWQERKAASFSMSPYYCGYTLGPSTGDARRSRAISPDAPPGEGYRPSAGWASHDGGDRRFTLGMAIATSGAALSSNRGRGTTAALAFLTTVFNVRLGRWSPNPRARGQAWRVSGPRFAPWSLILELFGYSNEARTHVHLSDGGHFDNTGVYELVRRRCGIVVLVDAAADPERSLDDLANLVRKCRVDFGADICLPLEAFQSPAAAGGSMTGHAFGKIHYAGEDKPADLVVIKPTALALKSLAVDVFSYGKRHASFPQQPTADQFFDESQFESYRTLGERIAEDCLTDALCPTQLAWSPAPRR